MCLLFVFFVVSCSSGSGGGEGNNDSPIAADPVTDPIDDPVTDSEQNKFAVLINDDRSDFTGNWNDIQILWSFFDSGGTQEGIEMTFPSLENTEAAVAVGIPVTWYPPAQIRTCATNAYGSY